MLKPELRNRIYQLNRERAVNTEKAQDLMALLGALPPGQIRNLLKDETCSAVLRKYGIEEVP